MNRIDIHIDPNVVRVNDDEGIPHKFSKYYYDELQKDKVDEGTLIKYGKNIFENVFSTEIRKNLLLRETKDLSDKDNLYIVISSEDQEIHNIPFELINIDETPNGFLLKRGNIHISRTVPSIEKEEEDLTLPVRILILISLPLEIYLHSPLDPLKELKVIYDALDEYLKKGVVEVDIEEKVNIPVLREKLLNNQYDIIHFTGHGAAGGKLIIEDEVNTTKGKEIEAEEVKNMFINSGVKLFYFNACETAKTSEINPSLAYNLFKALPQSYVLANIASVRDDLATETTRYIYETIMGQKEIGHLFYKTRIKLTNDWWKPVFFGIPDKRIMPEVQEIKKREESKKIVIRPAETIQNYVYRYSIVREASGLIQDNNYLVLHGIGGAGKSTFAIYLSQFFEAKFRHHLFFDLKTEQVTDPEILIDKIINTIRREELIDKNEYSIIRTSTKDLDHEERVLDKLKFVTEKLAGKTLLILDNLEDIIQDQDGLIKSGWRPLINEILNNHMFFTIFTSRIRPYLGPRQPLENFLEIGEYESMEFNFLFNNLNKEDKEYFFHRKSLISSLGGLHPLFLALAINKKFDDTEKLFELNEFKNVFEFYLRYFEYFQEETEKLFWFEYPISSHILEKIFSADFVDLMKNKLVILKDYNNGQIYEVYSVIKNNFIENFKLNEKNLIKLGNSLYVEFIEDKLFGFDRLNLFLLLIRSYEIKKSMTLEMKIIKVLNSIDFEKIIDFTYHLIINFANILDSFSMEKIKKAPVYNKLAGVYRTKGEYNLAIEYYMKALKIYEEKLGKDHPLTATTYNNLALVCHAKGEYDLAIEYYMKAVKINEDKLGKDHPLTATTYNNLAGVYYSKGEYDQAIEYYMKDLKIYEEKLGKDHPKTTTTYNNLASVYRAKGEYYQATVYSMKAVKINEDKLGKDNPETATTYNNLALVHRDKREYDQAIVYFMMAKKICEEKLGKDHPNTAMTYNNLALVYRDKGEYDLAILYYMKAIKINEKKLGKNHPNTAMAYDNLAVAFLCKGEYDKAIAYSMKAVKIFEEKLGKNYREKATTYDNLAQIYRAKGEYERAIEYSMKALKIYEKKLEKNHPEMAIIYFNLGNLNIDRKNYKEAKSYFFKALGIHKKRSDSFGIFYNYPGILNALILDEKSSESDIIENFINFLEYFEYFHDRDSQVLYKIMKDFLSYNTFNDRVLDQLDKTLKNNIERVRFRKFVQVLNYTKDYLKKEQAENNSSNNDES